ncbi:MAG: FAD:protein FMN transferase [Acidobacteriia bacterium]|nr:FAD:protein FMN transferase [Terriglobia bacterium]
MRLFLLVLAFLSAFPLPAQDQSVRYEASHDAMGTEFTVVAYGSDAKYLGEVANEAFEEIDRLDAQMSNYRPESEISALNRDAARRAIIVEPALFALIQDSRRYSQETDGAFDITVGPLIRAWGFFRGQGRYPSHAELTAAIERIGYRHIRLDAARREVRFDREGVELDLGGIAKGYAVDRAVEILREDGVTAALVSSGTSSVYALGAPPGERGWKVNVRDPFEAGKVGDVVWLKNYSLSVSGNYERFFTLQGKTYAHIMDPRSGRPVENMLATAVLAPRATQSDALSTAFFVLGPQASRRYLAAHPDLAVLFYQPGRAKRTFRRVMLRSASSNVPAGSLAEIGPP